MTASSDLLAAFVQRLGLESLEPDEAGLYNLLVDDSHMIFMRFDAEDEGVMFFGGIGTIDAEKAGETCRALLESNNFWKDTAGFTLSLIPGTLNVLLTARERLRNLDGEGLFQLFTRFVDLSDVWRKKLPTLPETSPSAEIQKSFAEAENADAGEYVPSLNELI